MALGKTYRADSDSTQKENIANTMGKDAHAENLLQFPAARAIQGINIVKGE